MAGISIAEGIASYFTGKSDAEAIKEAAGNQLTNTLDYSKLTADYSSLYAQDTANTIGQIQTINIQSACSASGCATAANNEIYAKLSAAYKEAGAISSSAYEEAAKKIYAVRDEEAAKMIESFNTYKDLVTPWETAGRRAIETLSDMPDFNFTPETFNFQADPSYDWRVEQGIQAIDNSSSARGMTLSGAQSKALMTYGQEMASQEYAAAFGRHMTTEEFRYQTESGEYATNLARLQGISNQGLTAAQGIGSAAITNANNIANFNMSGTQIGTGYEAAAAEAKANAITGEADAFAQTKSANLAAALQANATIAAAKTNALSAQNASYNNWITQQLGAAETSTNAINNYWTSYANAEQKDNAATGALVSGIGNTVGAYYNPTTPAK